MNRPFLSKSLTVAYGAGTRILLTVLAGLSTTLLAPATLVASGDELVAAWHFDEGQGRTTNDAVSGNSNEFVGHLEFAQGVRGSGLKFDGFTSRLVSSAQKLPEFGPALTVEAWIAPQEYSWSWTGIVDHSRDQREGFFLGINHLGQVGFFAAVEGRWLGCTSKQPVPLLKWSHVTGTFDPAVGFAIFVDGQLADTLAAQGKLTPAEGLDLLIGMAHRKQFPALTEREPSKKFLSNMVFDGLIDEVRIYPRVLDAAQIEASFNANRPANLQPLKFRVLPSGPKEPRPFGAYYTRLAYCPEWDRLWRTGDVADVLVCFGASPVRLVFWRGTSYCPAWVTENGKWVCDQSPESWDWEQWGCYEHMSDKRCHFSHVRILESNDARAVIHWRVASSSINYDFNHIDPDTNWGEWTDEYYYVYPDAVAVRYQQVHSPSAENMEWQQTELLNQPGTRPQDNVETNGMTIVNMRGETETWSWETAYGTRAADSATIEEANIQVMNLKAPQRHFVIGETGAYWKAFTFGAREGFSTMPCWNHWPVAQLPNDGRVTPAEDRPSSTCLGTLYGVKHKTDRPDLMTGRNLYGLTGKAPQELAVLARSWNFPADLTLTGAGFSSQGYDKNQRAYLLQCQPIAKPGTLELTLAGSDRSPILNPAFVVKGWGNKRATLVLNGKTISRGEDFRYGYQRTLEGTDLIVWVKATSRTEMKVSIQAP